MTGVRVAQCPYCETTAEHDPDVVLPDGSGWSTCPQCDQKLLWTGGSWPQ